MSSSFSSTSARGVMQSACAQVGLHADGAELMRMGENALFFLPAEQVVVRVARTVDYWADVRREVAVSRWLHAVGMRAAEVIEEIEQPVAVAGYPVTFWRYIPGVPAPYSRIGDLGALLRQLHSLAPPTDLDLPDQGILDRVEPRVEGAPIAEADRRFLLRRLGELREEVDQLEYVLAPCAVHGDAHIKNVMILDGECVLIDFERFGYGQPEWDLGMTATEYKTAGWWTPEHYQSFIEAYGFDVTQWRGFKTVQAVHQLKMTTWIMQNVNESEEIAAEFNSRMRTIRDGLRSTWKPR